MANVTDQGLSDSVDKSSVSQIRAKQKLRKKHNGLNIAQLSTGTRLSYGETNHINAKAASFHNVSALEKVKNKSGEDTYGIGIGTQFFAETNKRDEDEEMMKFIDLEMSKKKGIVEKHKTAVDLNKYMTPEEAALSALPDYLRLPSRQRSEEMLSFQMLNGIPEVDLGIETKIRNIEETEEAKHKLLENYGNKQEGPSTFVPRNVAVNFNQHNRYNMGNNSTKQFQQHPFEKVKTDQNVQEVNCEEQHTSGQTLKIKRASDDYFYDKFKKQYRRH